VNNTPSSLPPSLRPSLLFLGGVDSFISSFPHSLFTPGSRIDKIREALTKVPAVVLAFDFEDSVSYDR